MIPADSETNEDGSIEFEVRVPRLSLGGHTVSVTIAGDTQNALFKVVEAVPEPVADPSITIAPMSSEAGSEVTVTGMDFPAGTVGVKYGDSGILAYQRAGADGSVSITITVPSDAAAGSTNTITAESLGASAVSDTAEHMVSEPVAEAEPEPEVMAELMASPAEVTPGDSLTISGDNLSANMPVIKLDVGGMSVLPAGLITGPDGSFTATVTTPELDAGAQMITAVVSGDDPVTTMVTVMAVVSTDPADVFESLGDRLVRVWHLDRATQKWSFYDPDPALAAFNTLTEVTSGMDVSIIITEGEPIKFQSETLYAPDGDGTNPIRLD